MKFISGINKQKIEQNGVLHLDIPHYHRAPIGLLSSTKVYCVIRKYPSQRKTEVKELILTTIDPSKWHLYRKITLISNEGHGIIYAITNALQELEINVHIQEAITTEYDKVHSLTLIVDLHDYIKFNVKENCESEVSEKAIKKLRGILMSLQREDKSQVISNESDLTISKLGFLASNSSISQNTMEGIINHSDFGSPESAGINKGQITIASDIVRSLSFEQGQTVSYTMFSDTEERYLKVLFFNETQKVAFIDIVHKDYCGAISEFTKIISNQYGFNILASYSRQQDINGANTHWFALIDITGRTDEFYVNTLTDIKNCIYGGPKKYSPQFLWLIETLDNALNDDVLLRFGQSKKNEEGGTTSVYVKKEQLLTKLINEKMESKQDFNIENVIQDITMDKKVLSKSEERLVTSIQDKFLNKKRKEEELLQDQKKEQEMVKKKKKNRLRSKIISTSIVFFIIVVISFIYYTDLSKKLAEITNKVLLASSLAGLLLLFTVSEWLIHKAIEKFSQKGEKG